MGSVLVRYATCEPWSAAPSVHDPSENNVTGLAERFLAVTSIMSEMIHKLASDQVTLPACDIGAFQYG